MSTIRDAKPNLVPPTLQCKPNFHSISLSSEISCSEMHPEFLPMPPTVLQISSARPVWFKWPIMSKCHFFFGGIFAARSILSDRQFSFFNGKCSGFVCCWSVQSPTTSSRWWLIAFHPTVSSHWHLSFSGQKCSPYADMQWHAMDLYRLIGAIGNEHLKIPFGLYAVLKCRTHSAFMQLRSKHHKLKKYFSSFWQNYILQT